MMQALIDNLIDISLKNNLIEETDVVYVRNRILAMYNIDEYKKVELSEKLDIYQTLERLCDAAVEQGIIDDNLASRDIFSSTIMNEFLDKPSVINEKFYNLHKQDPAQATDWFYNMSKASNYIKVDRIAKNKEYHRTCPYGDMEITINLSKPEKDPKQIALEKLAPQATYPSCLLCVENEGYKGTIKHPDRANHRMIRMQLNDSDWCMQYSPYLYYNEHCIVLSQNHMPMKITKETFKTLLDFVTLMPHYFIGSNADLPIVGGSILSHEHYQGGKFTFPMDKAKTLFEFELNDYPNIKAQALNWPLSTIRLTSINKDELVECSADILDKWRAYSDPACEIFAYTEDVPHNTITPICRRNGQAYEIDLVLRNNRTSDEHPMGIFHSHNDVHHIKRENIGLIEVMGLAILPGRLLSELEEVKKYILDQPNEVAQYHYDWAVKLKSNYDVAIDIDDYIIEAVTIKFTRAIEDAGVYKLDEQGIAGFKLFAKSC